MKILKKLTAVGLLMALSLYISSCATTPNEEASPDVTEATADIPPGETSTPGADTSEADLLGENSTGQAQAQQAPVPAPDVSADALDAPPEAQTAQAAPPPPEVSEPASQPPVAEEPVSQTSGDMAQVTALDFKANSNGGTIVLKTNHPVVYSTKKNVKTNQFVIELKNTSIPAKFQRPYDTKEFSGPIASINGYQSSDVARIVVQLRGAATPSVLQKGSVIRVAGHPIADSDASLEIANSSEGVDVSAKVSSSQESEKDDGSLQTSSTDDLAFGATNKFYGRPISLELKDADVRDVFAFISEESGLNIVVGDDVTGKVTLKLRKIPWDQALMVLLQTKQLGYVRQGNILRISSLASIQKEADQARSALEAKRLLEPLHVQVFAISYADVTQIEAQAKDFLSTRGKTRADKRTNNLVVTDIDENLVKIKALVKRLDTQTPQVLIEAKIIEARESFNRLVGVDWSFGGAQVDTGGTNNQGQPVYLSPNAATSVGSTGFLKAGFSLGQLDVFGNLTASLNLLETEGLAKILSSPRIVTIDRQEAMITQSQQIPYVTTTTQTSTGTGTTVTTAPIPTISFVTVKLELVVKPQITVDGSVIMDIHLTRQFADPAVNGAAPGTESREAKTQVLVENGDTIVIGGIYQSDTTDSETGIPWLRKLPLLGWLFKNDDFKRSKNELVMFLTPRILNREKAFGKTGENAEVVSPAPELPKGGRG